MAGEYEDFGWEAADGLRLHARVYAGEGEARLPILCLHGLTRNARDFASVAPWLASRGHPVLAADVRGRGASAWDPEARYDLATYAEDAATLLAVRGIERTLILGTSMGGLIAMAMATRHPGLVAGAIVNDIGPVIAEAGLTRIAGYVGKPTNLKSWEDAENYVRWQNEAALPHFVGADWARMARNLLTERDGLIVPDYDPAIGTPHNSVTSHDPWAAWRALAAGPVLLLRGARSDILDQSVANAMVAVNPTQISLVELPAIGHSPTLDEPAARAAIAAFLDRYGGL